jgi:Tfp pilus assembly protein PilO
MAQRGRPKKQKTEPVMEQNEYVKLAKQFEQEQQVQLETLYKELANLKDKIGDALRQVALMDECETVAAAAFRAGRAYGPLSDANDKLETMLDNIYEANDFDHWDDVLNNF